MREAIRIFFRPDTISGYWYTSPYRKYFYATELPYTIEGKNVSMREYFLEMVNSERVVITKHNN